MEFKKDKNIDTIIRDTVFFGNNLVYYVFKRTQKISKAVYLISEIIKDTEPLKWSLRTVASSMMDLTGVRDIRQFSYEIGTKISSLKSLVLLANFSKNISEMNAMIIVRECDEILFSLVDFDSSSKQYLTLDKTFFDTPKDDGVSPFVSIIQGEKKDQQTGRDYKGQIKDRNIDMSFINTSKFVGGLSGDSQMSKDGIKDNAKSDRKKQILDIIKTMKDVTIKDISGQIRDCSEKTIQRELIGLLSDGVIKRTGDRRWSKYSLSTSV